MTPIQSGISINDPNVRAIDMKSLKKVNLIEASDELFQRFISHQQQFLEMRYTNPADTSNHPAYQDYATVQVKGKVVARIDNHGFVETSNAIGSKLLSELPGSVNGKSGPMLAQARAEKIAELLGGKVERSSTALTQPQFDRLPQPQSSLDVAAMQSDPMYEQLQKSKQARTTFLAQQIAQDGDAATSSTSNAATEFLDFMSKTPEERFFATFLKGKGLTEEEFEKLPPEERTDLMAEFKQELKDKTLQDVAESMARTT